MSAPKNRANNNKRKYSKKQKNNKSGWPESWYTDPDTIDQMSKFYEAEWLKDNKEGK